MLAFQSDFALSDRKYEQSPRVVVSTLIANATMQQDDLHYSGPIFIAGNFIYLFIDTLFYV